MTLLLTSEGIPKSIEDTFFSLLTKPRSEIKVAYITTAALDKGDSNPSWLEFNRQELRSFGIEQIVDIDLWKFTKLTLQEKLQNKDIIFVNGGNTYYLMKYVKESGFGELLPKFLEQGKLYIGVSAGSVIMGPDISLASWIPNNEDINRNYVTDTKGLGIVPFAIWPHFKESDKNVLQEKAKNVAYPIVALTDTQAVLWKDNQYTIVGDKTERIYTS